MKTMKKLLKKLLRMDNVECITNTAQKHPTLEADSYLLVQTSGMEPMMFTASQVEIAKNRAKKNTEDI
jgi:hypothetical protein